MIGRGLSVLDNTLTVKTDPYPETLARTSGYTGFGAIYQDRVRVTEPGSAWDQLLLSYLAGDRAQPVWGIGELAYHEEGHAGKRLSDVQTVLLVDSQSVTSALDALRNGAFYARRRDPEWGLQLDDFTLSASDGTDHIYAISGQTLTSARDSNVRLKLAVSATDGRSEQIRIKIIRSGQIWRDFSAQTPFQQEWNLQSSVNKGAAYYRVELGQGAQRLLSNPIFLQRQL